jgi:hypothetical protein
MLQLLIFPKHTPQNRNATFAAAWSSQLASGRRLNIYTQNNSFTVFTMHIQMLYSSNIADLLEKYYYSPVHSVYK